MISIEVGSALPTSHPLACCVGPAQLLTATFSHPHNLDQRLARGHTDMQDGTPVTPLDLLMQSVYERQIQRTNPGAWLLGEERLSTNVGSRVQSGTIYRGEGYIIDPVDGTSNLGRNHADVNTLVGYCEDGRLVGGMMCQPGVPTNSILVGYVNTGAYFVSINGDVTRQIFPPVAQSELQGQSVFIRSPNRRVESTQNSYVYRLLNSLSQNVKDFGRVFDSENEAAALRAFSMGTHQAVVLPPLFESRGTPKIWDVAAGLGIAASLGSRMTNWWGEPTTLNNISEGVVVSFPSNPIHDYILDSLSPGWSRLLTTPFDRTQ